MPLFASTILLSAFLLFLVQPIIAKQILPWFGGTSAVWTTCLVFFQVVLLGGLHVFPSDHTLSGAQARRRDCTSVACGEPAVFADHSERSAEAAAGRRRGAAHRRAAGGTIGLPYFLLSATGPLLQKWVAPRFPEKTVYRLFALSNFGSLIGLLAFPFAIEPFSTSHTQSVAWSVAYALFARRVRCIRMARRSGVGHFGRRATTSGSARPVRLRELAITSCGWRLLRSGSVLLLATTSHITQNIATVPFLWVLPLSLYLLTFVVAFEGRGGPRLVSARVVSLSNAAAAGCDGRRAVGQSRRARRQPRCSAVHGRHDDGGVFLQR